MRARSSLVLIPAALLAGVAVNILIAWAVNAPAGGFELQSRATISDIEVPAQVTEFISEPRHVRNISQGKASTVTLAVYGKVGCTKAIFRRTEVGANHGLLGRAHTDLKFGLPFRSLQYSVRNEEEDLLGYPIGSWRVEGTRGGWPLHREPAWPPPRIYPLTIIPFGFAANTLVYAAFVYSLLLLPGFLRRASRRRRGLCTACAYDRRGLSPDTPCPECSTANSCS